MKKIENKLGQKTTSGGQGVGARVKFGGPVTSQKDEEGRSSCRDAECRPLLREEGNAFLGIKKLAAIFSTKTKK